LWPGTRLHDDGIAALGNAGDDAQESKGEHEKAGPHRPHPKRGCYDTHLQALQRALDARYAACLGELDELMPDGVRWTHPGGGPTLWLEIPRAVELAAIEAYLLARGIHISNTSAAFVGPPHLHGFRIAYAYLSEDEMRRALTIVGDALRTLG
jgi:DNA-binding transcriptional MocR family regulator